MFQALIAEDIQRLERRNRTTQERIRLFVKRVVINVLVTVVLGTCGFIIYVVLVVASRVS